MTNLLLLLVIIGGLILFAGQNLSPTLALTFLGFQSPPLPLSAWIIIAIAAGCLSAIVISSLFQLSQSLGEPNPPRSTPSSRYSRVEVEPETEAEFDQPETPRWQPPPPPEPDPDPVVPASSRQNTNLSPDWDTEVQPLNPTWEGQPEAAATAERFNLDKEEYLEEEDGDWIEEEPGETDQTYETDQTPKTESWSGSVYSYGYRDQGESGVGKSESVYDADYRVIVPPPTTKIQSDDEEDDTLDSSQSDP